jgi:hypothetical protein
LRRIDRATVKALELTAPRASTKDTDDVRPKVLRGQVFSAFSERERKEIWARLEMVDGLILSLYTFFADIDYLRDCVDCVKRLVHVGRGVTKTVTSSLRKKLNRVPAKECQIVVQIAEDRFISISGSRADRVDLHVRQVYAFAMRHSVNIDPAVLRRFADLAARLGFDSDEIKLL